MTVQGTPRVQEQNIGLPAVPSASSSNQQPTAARNASTLNSTSLDIPWAAATPQSTQASNPTIPTGLVKPRTTSAGNPSNIFASECGVLPRDRKRMERKIAKQEKKIARLQAQLEKASTPEERAKIQERLTIQEAYLRLARKFKEPKILASAANRCRQIIFSKESLGLDAQAERAELADLDERVKQMHFTLRKQ